VQKMVITSLLLRLPLFRKVAQNYFLEITSK